MQDQLTQGNFTIRKVAQDLRMSSPTITRWINRYTQELLNVGIVHIKTTGFRRRIWVTDIDRFINFMRSKGAKIENNDSDG